MNIKKIIVGVMISLCICSTYCNAKEVMKNDYQTNYKSNDEFNGVWKIDGYDSINNWPESYILWFGEYSSFEIIGYRNRDVGTYTVDLKKKQITVDIYDCMTDFPGEGFVSTGDSYSFTIDFSMLKSKNQLHTGEISGLNIGLDPSNWSRIEKEEYSYEIPENSENVEIELFEVEENSGYILTRSIWHDEKGRMTDMMEFTGNYYGDDELSGYIYETSNSFTYVRGGQIEYTY